MTNYRWIFILFNLALLLGYFNYSVFKKEELLDKGRLVLLELAPVDPRSLMQGDYMQLRYKIATESIPDSLSKRGYCVMRLDSNGVANRVRLQPALTPLYTGECLIEYTLGKRALNIGAESFFFQEGQADKYNLAKYGGVKIDVNGNSLLIGLYDEYLKKIE